MGFSFLQRMSCLLKGFSPQTIKFSLRSWFLSWEKNLRGRVKNPQNLNQGDNKISTSEVYTDKNNYPYQATLRKRIEGIHYSAALKKISAVSQLHWHWDQSIRIFSLGFTTVVVLLVRISNVIYQHVRSRGRTNLAPSYNLLTEFARSALFGVPIRSVKNAKTWQVTQIIICHLVLQRIKTRQSWFPNQTTHTSKFLVLKFVDPDAHPEGLQTFEHQLRIYLIWRDFKNSVGSV